MLKDKASDEEEREILVESLSPLLDPIANEDTQEVIFDELLQPFRPRLTRSRSAPNARRLNTIEPAPSSSRADEVDDNFVKKSHPVLKKKKSFSTEEALQLTKKRKENSSQHTLLGFRHFQNSDKFPKGVVPAFVSQAVRRQ